MLHEVLHFTVGAYIHKKHDLKLSWEAYSSLWGDMMKSNPVGPYLGGLAGCAGDPMTVATTSSALGQGRVKGRFSARLSPHWCRCANACLTLKSLHALQIPCPPFDKRWLAAWKHTNGTCYCSSVIRMRIVATPNGRDGLRFVRTTVSVQSLVWGFSEQCEVDDVVLVCRLILWPMMICHTPQVLLMMSTSLSRNEACKWVGCGWVCICRCGFTTSNKDTDTDSLSARAHMYDE